MSSGLQIYQALRDMILKLDLEPGAPILKEEVAQAFGVSPMPVREALRKLEEEDLVQIKPQSGTYVTPINVQLAKEAQFLRIGVEIEVIRSVVPRVGEDGLREVRAILRRQRLEFEADDKLAFTRDDAAFHAAIYRLAGVEGLWAKIGTMRAHIDRLRMMHLLVGRKMESILADHASILSAIEARDRARAEAATRAHLSDTLSEIERLRERYPSYF